MAASLECVLQVKVVPGASRDRIAGAYGEGIKVQVSAAPERGKANAAVVKILAEWLRLPAASFTLVGSPSNPRKQFRIVGLSGRELAEQIRSLG